MDLDVSQDASERRAEAARMSRAFATEDDLVTLLSVAEHGLGALFGGTCTIQLGVGPEGEPDVAPEWIPSSGLQDEVMIGLTGPPSSDLVVDHGGILLVPYSNSGVCRAWVQFATPRRVGAEEMIVGDLFAQAFAIGVDRVVALDQAEKREFQLRAAVEGHRIIGQATGILMERHRLTAAVAFGRLRTASQNRNIKLREIAERVIDTGLEPDVA